MTTMSFEVARYVADEQRWDHMEKQARDRSLRDAGIQPRGFIEIAICSTICAFGRLLIRFGSRLEQYDPSQVTVPQPRQTISMTSISSFTTS